MRRTHRQRTKLIRPLAPPVIINSQHHSGHCYTDNQLSHSQTQCGRPKTLPQGHHPANLTVTCIFRLNPPSDFGGKRPPVSVQTALPFR
jgi:hypothetical protein